MTAGLQSSNSMSKDLSGWKLIDIHFGDKEANRHSVTNPPIQTLIPKADQKDKKAHFGQDLAEKYLNFRAIWKPKTEASATECQGCFADKDYLGAVLYHTKA